jgi:ABC-type nitrate/sulfonate/bicarbonate transport system permease component
MTDEPKKPEPAKPAPAKPEAVKPAAQVAKPAAAQVVAPPPWWRRLRADPPVPIRMALGGALVFLVFLFWWFITHGPVVERIISPAKLPSPGEVWDSISLMGERHLGDSIFDTLQRVFLGVGIASLVGVTLGVVAASHRGVSAALGPLVIFLRSVPMGALLPLTLILFSTGEEQKIMFIFLAIVPFVFSDTMKAVSLVPERYVETAQTLGASRTQIILKVLVPLSIPDIITSIRFQVGLALGYIMLAEEIDTPRGLGQLIMGSEREGPREHVYLLLFIIALLAYVIDLTLRTIQRGAFTWRRDL